MTRAAKVAVRSALALALVYGGAARAASWLEDGDAGDHTASESTRVKSPDDSGL